MEDDAVQFSAVRARFNPKRLDTLRPELCGALGAEAVFMYAWPIEEADGGPYVGQWALTTFDPRFLDLWVPEEDLEVLGAADLKEFYPARVDFPETIGG